MDISTERRSVNLVGPLLAAIDLVTIAAGWGAAFAMVAIVALILGEVASRNLFDYSLKFSWEFSGYAMGLVFFLGAGEALRTRGHVRVGILMETLSPEAARRVDLACTALGLAFSAFAAAGLLQLALSSLATGSASWTGMGTPLWIPQLGCAVGLVVMALQMLARLIRLWIDVQPDDPPAIDFSE